MNRRSLFGDLNVGAIANPCLENKLVDKFIHIMQRQILYVVEPLGGEIQGQYHF